MMRVFQIYLPMSQTPPTKTFQTDRMSCGESVHSTSDPQAALRQVAFHKVALPSPKSVPRFPQVQSKKDVGESQPISDSWLMQDFSRNIWKDLSCVSRRVDGSKPAALGGSHLCGCVRVIHRVKDVSVHGLFHGRPGDCSGVHSGKT